MNIGDCPYDGCDGVIMIEVPEHTPAYVETDCDECHRPIWYMLSRLEPMAWTKEDFEKEFIVDRGAKTIVKRDSATERK